MSLGCRGSTLAINLLAVAVFTALASVVAVAARNGVHLSANHLRQAQAQAIAEAGLEDALHSLYVNPKWRDGFLDKPFAGGSYTVTVTTGSIARISAKGYSPGLFSYWKAVKEINATAVFKSSTTPGPTILANRLKVGGTIDAYDPLYTLTPSTSDFIPGVLIFSNTDVDMDTVAHAPCPPTRILGDVSYHDTPAPRAACISGEVLQSTYTLPLPVTTCASCETVNDNGLIFPATAYTTSGGPKLNVADGATVVLSSGTYYFEDITFTGTGLLVADTSTGTVRIFYHNKLQETTGCRLVNTSKIPSRLFIGDLNTDPGPGSGHLVELQSLEPLHAYLEGAAAHFTLREGTELYGHITGRMVEVTWGQSGKPAAKLHYDIGSGVSYDHVTWALNAAGAWREGF